MILKKIFLCLFIGFSFSSCDVTEKSIDDPRLPVYSDFGANSAGWLTNGVPCRKTCIAANPWGNDCYGESLGVDTVENFTRIFLTGQSLGGNTYNGDQVLYFDLLNLVIDTVPDLVTVNGRSFEIDGLEVRAGIDQHLSENSPCHGQSFTLSGKLYLHKVSKFSLNNLDNQPNWPDTHGIIISGTFAFTQEMLCGRFEVTYGRFDVRVENRQLRVLND